MSDDIFIIEIKARVASHDRAKKVLEEAGARYVGLDQQVDTYFAVPSGRLKLRKGEIESALIAYNREEETRLKESSVVLYKSSSPVELEAALSSTIGVRATVEKIRAIYFIDNVKFHLDDVFGLGSFVEIEAISEGGTPDAAVLTDQVNHFMEAFGIADSDLVRESYVDLVSL